MALTLLTFSHLRSGPTCALVLAVHKMLEFLDSSSRAVYLLFVDFAKAFDKVRMILSLWPAANLVSTLP